MGIKKEKVTKKAQSSKKRQNSQYMEDGRSKTQKNLYELRNSEKRIKKTMQRLIESEIGELEELQDMDDLYETPVYDFKKKVASKGQNNTRFGELKSEA